MTFANISDFSWCVKTVQVQNCVNLIIQFTVFSCTEKVINSYRCAHHCILEKTRMFCWVENKAVSIIKGRQPHHTKTNLHTSWKISKTSLKIYIPVDKFAHQSKNFKNQFKNLHSSWQICTLNEKFAKTS